MARWKRETADAETLRAILIARDEQRALDWERDRTVHRDDGPMSKWLYAHKNPAQARLTALRRGDPVIVSLWEVPLSRRAGLAVADLFILDADDRLGPRRS